MADQWLTILEYARYYNMSDMTVRRRIKAGKIEAILKEGKYYIPLHAARGSQNEGPASHNEEVEYSPSQQWSPNHPRPKPQHHRPRPHYERYERFDRPSRPSSQHGHPHGRSLGQPQASLGEREQVFEPRPKQAALVTAFEDPAPSLIPPQIRQSIAGQPTVMLESKALLTFCESVLERLREAEERLEGDFRNKVAALEEKTKTLEAQVNAKDIKLNELQQQVEDLQLLVQIIEKLESNKAS